MPELERAANKQPGFRRVAIVHEWLVVWGGAEVVLRELVALYPDCDLFSVVDFLSDEGSQVFPGQARHHDLYSKAALRKEKISRISAADAAGDRAAGSIGI